MAAAPPPGKRRKLPGALVSMCCCPRGPGRATQAHSKNARARRHRPTGPRPEYVEQIDHFSLPGGAAAPPDHPEKRLRRARRP
eukprot:1895182-Alexandrium_andersonii.AAC.1